MMEDDVRGTIETTIAELGERLEDATRALRGEAEFEAENVRQLRTTIEKMAPIVAMSKELRRRYPDIAPRLDRYKSQLSELQTITHQLQVVLVTKQASLAPSQSQNVAVSRWVTALQQTR
jgi:hypothetical protein